ALNFRAGPSFLSVKIISGENAVFVACNPQQLFQREDFIFNLLKLPAPVKKDLYPILQRFLAREITEIQLEKLASRPIIDLISLMNDLV
ncbi:MAG: hypothetical protein ACFFBD_23060, partial [Candidatus Hodarchaeota archaeon]